MEMLAGDGRVRWHKPRLHHYHELGSERDTMREQLVHCNTMREQLILWCIGWLFGWLLDYGACA
jgi:hypothetical protein